MTDKEQNLQDDASKNQREDKKNAPETTGSVGEVQSDRSFSGSSEESSPEGRWRQKKVPSEDLKPSLSGEYLVPGDNNETTQIHSYPVPPNLAEKAKEIAEEDAHHELKETDKADTDSKNNIAKYLPNSTSISIRTQITRKLGEKMFYKINPEKPGLFVMINNIKFDHEQYRHGAENDEEGLKALMRERKFEIYHGPTGKGTTNLTDQEMENTLEDVGKNMGKHESLILVISSHGDDGVVYGTDHKKDSALELKTNKIVQKFMNKNWAGKPKMIIFQACQGEVFDKGFEIEEAVKTDETAADKVSRKKKNIIPEQSDLIVVFSSDSPHPSMRDPKQGSHLLQVLIRTVKELGDDFDLLHIILIVIHDVAEQVMNCTDLRSGKPVVCKQNPCFKSYMGKLFYFPSQSSGVEAAQKSVSSEVNIKTEAMTKKQRIMNIFRRGSIKKPAKN